MKNKKVSFYFVYLLLFLSEAFLCASFAPKLYIDTTVSYGGFEVVKTDNAGNIFLFFVLPFLIGLSLLATTIWLKKKDIKYYDCKNCALVFIILFSFLNIIGVFGCAIMAYLEISSFGNIPLFVLHVLVSIFTLVFSEYFVWSIYKKIKENLKNKKFE